MFVLTLSLLGFLLCLVFPGQAHARTIETISTSAGGAQGNALSDTPAISADGRFVAFVSFATNLVPEMYTEVAAVLVHDRQTGALEPVSAASNSFEGHNAFSPSISADGRYVAFESLSDGLVPGDTNGALDVFVRDRQTRTTTRVSISTSGSQGNGGSNDAFISADGRYVAFCSEATNLVSGDSNGMTDIFVRDRQTGTTSRVSVSSAAAQANQSSYSPAMSADGRFVVFDSGATNLASGDANGTYSDILVRDMVARTTVRVSVSTSGIQGNKGSFYPSISADGRYVAFESGSSNMVANDTNNQDDIFVRDRTGGTTVRANVSASGTQANAETEGAVISANGRFVAFRSWADNLVPGDTGGNTDIFVRDLVSATTTIANLTNGGGQDNDGARQAAMSADGRYVAFASESTDLVPDDTNNQVDTFVRDRDTGLTTRASVSGKGLPCNGPSWAPSMSADGRYVAFDSVADDLIPADTNSSGDVFVRDRETGTVIRASVASNGTQGNQDSDTASISADGRYVAFESLSSNLVAGDSGGFWDVFVHDCQSGSTVRATVSTAGTQGNGNSGMASTSADGRYVAFVSAATNLVADDTNGCLDVFVRDLQSNTTTRVSVDGSGLQASADNWLPAISGDGRYVAFASDADNLVAGDSNASSDIFVHDCQTGSTVCVSVAGDASAGNDNSDDPAISSDGRYVAFDSLADSLVPGDTNRFLGCLCP